MPEVGGAGCPKWWGEAMERAKVTCIVTLHGAEGKPLLCLFLKVAY